MCIENFDLYWHTMGPFHNRIITVYVQALGTGKYISNWQCTLQHRVRLAIL